MFKRSKLQSYPQGLQDLTYQDQMLTTVGTVQKANEMAWSASRDAPIRALAAQIVRHHGPVESAETEYPVRIWHWIRENVEYQQEAPVGEILNGPYHTLPPVDVRIGGPRYPKVYTFPGFGVGDCDDLSILFATLCCSLNVHAYLAAFAYRDTPDSFFHAKGYAGGRFFELSKDEAYGGWKDKPLVHRGLFENETALIYSPGAKRFYRIYPSDKK